VVAPERLIADLVPPPRFDAVRFETYLPDPAQPSQAAARAQLAEFAASLTQPPAAGGRRRWSRRRGGPAPSTGVYLDGGYGVGKTHLLASLWHAAPAPKAFGTFVEITNLVGALGFGAAASALSRHRLVAIDEFELDDPGDTVLVSSLLSRLVEAGVTLAATSNTLPDRLGEGRFAAADFLREIQRLAASFQVLRIDGEDYRHRTRQPAPPSLSDDQLADAAHELPDASLDEFDALTAHLASLHPSRYGALLDGVGAVCLRGVRRVEDQAVALRLVVLADRLYDRQVPVRSSGAPLEELFSPEMLHGGYRKKYLRATSRLLALAREGVDAPARAGG
jgi:cell division protein ZapE